MDGAGVENGITGGYTCADFHPDGLILGMGTADSLVRIWEARARKVCTLPYFTWRSPTCDYEVHVL